jgi:hypothetical protein
MGIDEVHTASYILSMNTTKQIGFAFSEGSMFALQPGCEIDWKGEAWIVLTIYDAHCSGRIPLLAVNLVDGRNGMPFVDEVKVTKPAVQRGFKHEMSQETAERFADWNRRGNGR